MRDVGVMGQTIPGAQPFSGKMPLFTVINRCAGATVCDSFKAAVAAVQGSSACPQCTAATAAMI
jgi:hypothetical protein